MSDVGHIEPKSRVAEEIKQIGIEMDARTIEKPSGLSIKVAIFH